MESINTFSTFNENLSSKIGRLLSMIGNPEIRRNLINDLKRWSEHEEQELVICEQFTEEEAITLANEGFYKSFSNKATLASLQLIQKRLFMPFGEFHSIVEEVIGEAVTQISFAYFSKKLAATCLSKIEPDQ